MSKVRDRAAAALQASMKTFLTNADGALQNLDPALAKPDWTITRFEPQEKSARGEVEDIVFLYSEITMGGGTESRLLAQVGVHARRVTSMADLGLFLKGIPDA